MGAYNEEVLLAMISDLLRIIMLFGVPCSGKSTHRRFLEAAIQAMGLVCAVVNVGDLLEEWIGQAQKDDLFAAGLKRLKENAELVPPEIPMSFFLDPFRRGTPDVIITDGIGRRSSEIERILKMLHNIVPKENLRIDVVYLNASWIETVKRFEERSGGGEVRIDDTLENLKRRRQSFFKHTLPVIDDLRDMEGVEVHEIVVDGETKRAVHCKIASRVGFPPASSIKWTQQLSFSPTSAEKSV